MELRKCILPFSFKNTGEGTFTGYGNVTGVTDLGNDRVVRGAFQRDLRDRGSIRPLLWSHDSHEPIGVVSLDEDDYGLRVTKGQLVLAVQRAAETYALLKTPGALGGMSIGFEVVRERSVGGIREILELKTWEVSLCCFPMNTLSVVDSVKNHAAGNEAARRELVDALQDFNLRMKVETIRIGMAQLARTAYQK